ncbi:P-loop containing nucleoside triphosphate hydrolase protein [Apiospora arundinis]
MKFTGILVPFLAACAQASLPYNIRDTDSQQAAAEPRHLSKSHHGHHGYTGTGGLPHHHRPSKTGHHGRPHPTGHGGMLPGYRGSVAESDNDEPKAWGGEQHHWGGYPHHGKGKGKGKGHAHGTGLMSVLPFPRPTGTGGHHHPPGHGSQPPQVAQNHQDHLEHPHQVCDPVSEQQQQRKPPSQASADRAGRLDPRGAKRRIGCYFAIDF